MTLIPITQQQAQSYGLGGQAAGAAIQQPVASLEQTQSAIPGTKAQSQTAQVTAQQAQAPQQLSADLKNKMTLSDALSKYTALKMNPNDIFKQYLSENTWGPNGTPAVPIENPNQLQNLGVNTDVLGKTGEISSFLDRWNSRNAIEELRTAKDYFNQTKAADIAGNTIGVNANSKAYENARIIAGEHLSSLIPGVSGAQATGNILVNMLPTSKDLRSYTPEMIDKAFSSVENMLMTSRGYNYDTLRLTPDSGITKFSDQNTPSSGKDLLNTLVQNAGKDIQGIGKGLEQQQATALSPLDILNPERVQEKLDVNNPLTFIKGVAQPYKNILDKGPLEAFKEQPVTTSLAVLAPLLGLKGGSAAEGEAGAAEGASGVEAAKPNIPGTPGKLQTAFKPQNTMEAGQSLKDNAVNFIDKSGSEISAQNIVNKIKAEMPLLKKSFSGVTNKDIEEITTELNNDFKGNMTAKDARKIYNQIPDSYTSTGIAKQDFNSALNAIKKQAISNEIEKTAPGMGWQAGIDAQRRAFLAQKGPLANVLKPVNIARYGLGAVGLNEVRKLLGI